MTNITEIIEWLMDRKVIPKIKIESQIFTSKADKDIRLYIVNVRFFYFIL